jgi:hypothetical protein
MSISNTTIEPRYHSGRAAASPVVDVLIGTPVIGTPAARVNSSMPALSIIGRIMGNTNSGFSFSILKEPKRVSLTFMKITWTIGYSKLLSISGCYFKK